mmetsp:Transcript_63515/g.161163  ORF Transcript_63515/g.161163 Transcript_63515/m.161163 type:complete len:253 (+) Transcript_63515:45-803(+)
MQGHLSGDPSLASCLPSLLASLASLASLAPSILPFACHFCGAPPFIGHPLYALTARSAGALNFALHLPFLWCSCFCRVLLSISLPMLACSVLCPPSLRRLDLWMAGSSLCPPSPRHLALWMAAFPPRSGRTNRPTKTACCVMTPSCGLLCLCLSRPRAQDPNLPLHWPATPNRSTLQTALLHTHHFRCVPTCCESRSRMLCDRDENVDGSGRLLHTPQAHLHLHCQRCSGDCPHRACWQQRWSWASVVVPNL